MSRTNWLFREKLSRDSREKRNTNFEGTFSAFRRRIRSPRPSTRDTWAGTKVHLNSVQQREKSQGQVPGNGRPFANESARDSEPRSSRLGQPCFPAPRPGPGREEHKCETRAFRTVPPKDGSRVVRRPATRRKAVHGPAAPGWPRPIAEASRR